MTWGDFKKGVEEKEVKDDTDILFIDWSADFIDWSAGLHKGITVEWDDENEWVMIT